jgi:hypothetical protein
MASRLVSEEKSPAYVVCPKSKCTDFSTHELGTQHLVGVYGRVGSDLGCMSILISTGLVESVMRYCCLCIVVFYNPVTFCDAGKCRTTVRYQILCETQ